MAKIQTNFNNTLQNENNYINYAVNNVMLNMNTFLPAVITQISGLRCTVQTIINTIATNQPTPPPSIIANVPIGQLIGGTAGITIHYQVGDVVLCGAIQRDISSIKNSWSQANPASNRKFSLSDVIVLFKLSNSLPATFIDISAGTINITTTAGGTVNVNADHVNLGNGAANAVLLEGVNLTIDITGVQPGTGVTGVTAQVTAGGSSNVKGKI